MELKVTIIGVIRSPFPQAEGTPIQPCSAQGVEGLVDVLASVVAVSTTRTHRSSSIE